jgi:hypothetical protein
MSDPVRRWAAESFPTTGSGSIIARNVKIFISYSTDDLPLAERVFGEMVRAGATAFQYGRSETIGKPSWEQVLDWISESDVFIVLVSTSALASKPVRAEIEQAHYSYLNHDHPDKIVVAIVEKGVKPWREIERFARVDMLDYDTGMNRLMSQLGLARKPRVAPAPLTLPDFGTLYQEFKRRHPAPTPAAKFAAQAEKIVANYDAVKPPEVKETQRARHLDSILAQLAGGPQPRKPPPSIEKIDSLFLGYDPGKGVSPPVPLAESLLHWKGRKSALEAPLLAGSGFSVTWSAVAGATGYVLEGSATKDFASSAELYRGAETKFAIPILQLRLDLPTPEYFRVKAIGGVFMADSGWSNVVPRSQAASAIERLFAKPTYRPKLETPTLNLLDLSPMFERPSLSWSAVEGAAEYVLERSGDALFSSPQEAYKGPRQTYTDFGHGKPLTFAGHPLLVLRLKDAYYRVKAGATATRDGSDWSNVVRWSEAP